MKGWSRTLGPAVLVGVLGCAGGCAEGVKLVRVSESGGVVIYPYKEGQGALVSPHRSEAIRVIERHCGGSYSIAKEGQVKPRMRVMEQGGLNEIVTDHRWGLEFKCKGRDK